MAGSFGQAATVGGAPVGLVIAVVGAGCLIVGARAASGSRAAGLAAAVGVLAAIGMLSMPSPGGSVVFPAADQARVLIWVAAPVIVAVLMLVWPRRRRPAAARDGM